jgi:hypothetical protein
MQKQYEQVNLLQVSKAVQVCNQQQSLGESGLIVVDFFRLQLSMSNNE